VLAFGILFLGVPYHLPASVSSERSGGMTDLLTSAGCSQAARLASWMAAEGVAYLPAYLIGAGVHATTLFTRTSAAAVLAFYVLPALALAAWSLFLSTFFRSSALSGIVVTGIAILGLIVGLLTNDSGDGAAVPIAFVLPSSSITYSFTIASRFETAGRATNLVQRAPSDGSGSETIGGTLIAQYAINLVAIIVFPLLAAAVERRLFYRSASRADKRAAAARAEEGEKERPALEITNLVKRYGRKKKGVLAVDDLSFEVPQGGLTALLGSNGSGKSTTMACVTGLEAFSSGSILVDGWPRDMMPPGTVGFAPQRNVNWSELNALQHVQVFHAIKHRSGKRSSRAKHEALLEHVELAHKMKTRPGAMSGGMRRKLQLAMALVGDSSLLLVDEATTGLDPLARRSIWKILLAQRGTRTILFTTHAIDDEVDVLSDDVIILGAPGKQLARGSPVRLKQTLGAEDGTLVHVVLRDAAQAAAVESAVAAAVGEDVATRRIAAPSVEEVSLRLSTQDTAAVQRALDAVEKDKEQLGVLHYDVHGPSLENVFLRLRAAHEQAAGREVEVLDEKIDAQDSLNLHEGKQRGWFKLTIAQWLKRAVIFRRSWFAPLGAIAVAILGSLIPTYIFLDDRNPSCGGPRAQRNVRRSLFLEPSAGSILGLTTPPQDILLAPPGPLDTILGASYPLQASSLTQISAAEYNQTFSSFDTARDIGFGGALLVEGQTPQFAYQAQPDFLALQAPASALANLVANAQAFQASENAPIIFPFSLRISSSFAGTGLGDAL
jgi:ABC-type multidrug transport system ATPase subunit